MVVKLFVTRFHCVCPDYRYIVCSTETGTFGVKMIFGQHRFENSHSNSGLKEKSEGAVEMADSILRYFSQRLLSLSSAILKWNQGRWGGKILQYLALEKGRDWMKRVLFSSGLRVSSFLSNILLLSSIYVFT